jgi:hypothetical protein
MHFMPGWSYYDIYDSFRKLLLTSVVLFVADPSSPSRALFLLSVDAVALVVLAGSKPYKYRGDDLLSFSLLTIEFAIFLMALLFLSDAATIANYSTKGMLTATFVLIISAFIVFVPFSWVTKLRVTQESIQKYTGAKLHKSIGRDSMSGGEGDGTELTATIVPNPILHLPA